MMARSRILKPEFWSDEKLALVPREAPSSCAGDGVLGYDLLRYCELSLGPEDG